MKTYNFLVKSDFIPQKNISIFIVQLQLSQIQTFNTNIGDHAHPDAGGVKHKLPSLLTFDENQNLYPKLNQKFQHVTSQVS